MHTIGTGNKSGALSVIIFMRVLRNFPMFAPLRRSCPYLCPNQICLTPANRLRSAPGGACVRVWHVESKLVLRQILETTVIGITGIQSR